MNVMSTVVQMPHNMLCPTCAGSLWVDGGPIYHIPPPPHVRMRCLNGRCTEKGIVKRVPLTSIDVEVEDVGPD